VPFKVGKTLALTLAAGIVTAASVTPAVAQSDGFGGSFMIKNVGTGLCLTADNYSYGWHGVHGEACNRSNSSQWWANYQDNLVLLHGRVEALTRFYNGYGFGVVGVDTWGSPSGNSNQNWWYGGSPSVIGSFAGGYLTMHGQFVSLYANSGNYSKWYRVS
jgi:hypothetical protein